MDVSNGRLGDCTKAQRQPEAAYELPAEPLAGSGQQGNGHHLSELVSNTRLTPVDSQKKYNIHNRHCMYTYIYIIIL